MFKQIKLNLNQIRMASWLWVFAMLLLPMGEAWGEQRRAVDLEFNRGNALSSEFTFLNYSLSWQWQAESKFFHYKHPVVCEGAKSSESGACPNSSTTGEITGKTTIRLVFELNGGERQQELTLSGSKYYPAPIDQHRPINHIPDFEATSSPQLRFSINAGELQKLTTPGTWRAVLVTHTKHFKTEQLMQTRTFEFLIKVTDYHNQQIYLPDGNDNVRLNWGIRPDIGNPNQLALHANRSQLRLCLYDGNNSKSTNIDMQFIGEGDTTHSDLFSIYRNNSSRQEERDRIDYTLTMSNPIQGASDVSIKNDKTWIKWETWRAIPFTKQKHLINGETVECVPVTLNFLPKDFKLIEKNPGNYTGTLRVLYTPSTQKFYVN